MSDGTKGLLEVGVHMFLRSRAIQQVRCALHIIVKNLPAAKILAAKVERDALFRDVYVRTRMRADGLLRDAHVNAQLQA